VISLRGLFKEKLHDDQLIIPNKTNNNETDINGGYELNDSKSKIIKCENNIDLMKNCLLNNEQINQMTDFNEYGYHLIMHEGKFIYVPVIILTNTYFEQKYINPNKFYFKFIGDTLVVMK